MKPITTAKELGEMEALFRQSERLRVAAWLRQQAGEYKQAGNDPFLIDTLYLLADAITAGEQWTPRNPFPPSTKTLGKSSKTP